MTDYVFFSRSAGLRLQQAQVFNPRDRNGVRVSDRKPLLVTFTLE
jgi:hypothetical protein